jgi:hypothetical protein
VKQVDLAFGIFPDLIGRKLGTVPVHNYYEQFMLESKVWNWFLMGRLMILCRIELGVVYRTVETSRALRWVMTFHRSASLTFLVAEKSSTSR